MFRRKKPQIVPVEEVVVPEVLSGNIPLSTIQGEPTKNRNGHNVMTGVLTRGVDDLAQYQWCGALATFALVAYEGYRGYRFEDGDYGIDGYFASEHPLSRMAQDGISLSAREWGLQHGDAHFANTWLNGYFYENDAKVMHHLVLSRYIGVEPQTFHVENEWGSGTFSHDWGHGLVPAE